MRAFPPLLYLWVVKYTYTVHLQPAEDGGFVVTVPALPGCITQAETYEEALAMAEECIEGFLEALVKAGQAIPEEPAAQPLATRLTVEAPVAV